MRKRLVMAGILALSLATVVVILGRWWEKEAKSPLPTQTPAPAPTPPAPAPAQPAAPAPQAPAPRPEASAPAQPTAAAPSSPSRVKGPPGANGDGKKDGGTHKVEPAPIPAFPWPPPPASAETMIPDKWLPTRGEARLADVANSLERALTAAKYHRWSYSSVPNGFALVSQMEQIKSDGTPSPEPARWSTDLPWVGNMTLLEFIRALANAQPGYYRVIVFIVTNQPWSQTGEKPTGEEAEHWLAKGFNWLPDSIGKLTYGPDYRTIALVYEFKKVAKDADATFLEPSPTSAEDHLKKAGIYDPLSRP
jgi:hypothetical protein